MSSYLERYGLRGFGKRYERGEVDRVLPSQRLRVRMHRRPVIDWTKGRI